MKENNIIRFFKYVFFYVSLIIGISSCDLDVIPGDKIASDKFWTSEKDAWSNLNTVYSALMPGSGIYSDSFTDDVYCQYSWESNGALFQTDGLNVGAGKDDLDPKWDFEGIRKANIFLKGVVNCPLDEEVKERMKAEARFLRAYGYLSKTLQFGKVPIMTEPLIYDGPYVQRNSVEEVRKFIIDELEAVSKILPESYSGGYLYEKGRVTKYAAISMKARAALYFGDYPMAEAAAEEVISSKKYSLFRVSSLNAVQQKEANEMDAYIDFAALGIDKDKFVKGMFSYESLWHTENANPDNPEYIMARQYMALKDYQNSTAYIRTRPNQLGGWSSITPTQSLVDAYWTADGELPNLPTIEQRKEYYSAIKQDRDTEGGAIYDFVQENVLPDPGKYDYIQEFRNRDSRLYVSIMIPYKGWYETNYGDQFVYEWLKGGNNESKTGFNFRKTLSLNKDIEIPDADGGAGDFPSIRYAEVLLIYAEARTQNVGFDGRVQEVLNDIRDRCGMPDVPTSLSKEAGLELIQRERRVELAGEGFRWHDMTRYSDEYWENAMNNLPLAGPDGEVLQINKWSSRMRLRPVPQLAIDANPLLVGDQNPGY